MSAGTPTLGRVVLTLVVAGGLIGLLLAILAWRRREDTPAATTYGLLMAFVGVWALTYAGQLASPTAAMADAFYGLVLLTAIVTPFIWFTFAVIYTGHGDWLTPRRLTLVFAEPLVYYVLFLTNPLHRAAYDNLTHYQWEGLHLIGLDVQLLGWIQIAIMYGVSIAGLLLLAAFVTRTRNVHRRQATAILLGAFITMVGNVIFLSGLSPYGALDVTPLFFVVNGTVIFWAFFRYDFLDVAPLAQDVLVEEITDPIVVLDDDRTVVDYNAAAAERLGLEDESIGKPVAVTLPGLPDSLAAGESLEVADANGKRAVYDPRTSPLEDQYGIERGQLVVLREVTLLTRREETLAALQTVTRDLMRATTIEDVADVTIETAADVLDHRFAGFLRYDADHDLLRSVALTDPVADRLDADEMLYDHRGGIVWEAFEDKELKIEESYDMGAAGRMNEIPLASTVLLPLGDHGLLGVGSLEEAEYSDDDIRFLRILASATESALDRLAREREVREGRDALEERNERLEEFASIVSHDLQTPLTTAKGYLSLAMDQLDDDTGYLEKVDNSHDRMADLIEDLLALARHGVVVSDAESVPLDAVAIDAWQTAGDFDASLDVIDPPSPVVADRERVRTLFENLFRNAIEHGGTDVHIEVGALAARTSDGGATATDGPPEDGPDRGALVARTPGKQADPAESDPAVEESDDPAGEDTAASDPGQVIGFYVADDGPGIPPEERNRVFEQGYSADNGTGLGLAIVDRIAEAHDWDIEISDSGNGGARFEITGVEVADVEPDE